MTRTVRRPGRRATLAAAVLAPVLGLAASVGLVWQSSSSAFSATTDNGPDSWAAGTVTLTDNDAGTALFTVTRMAPGATGTRCIAVTSTGTVPSSVKLYGTGLTTTNALSSYLTLTVTQGTGAAADCSDFTTLPTGAAVYSGTLAGFTAATYAAGYGTWNPTGAASETRAYRFTYAFSASAPNSTQGGSAQVGFTWEAQSV
ncbi:hypothetical protein GCM10027451_46640 [Geodermatophilus aquaeductus]|uniref:Camelysin metallo-endopeptidase n=1 Tax=Geodermatophilus aquaeductus TaxID=1564161 RepID=A0A521FUR8_9ACTN|nr:hypothetical protein [Geodermatophilus aquaeductus]SMO99310.1 hypothetical protein SAMN06273567_11616 [Geodermatophilus aquaeductus]